MTRYTYAVEVQAQAGGEWYPIVRHETRDFCLGYILALRDQPPPRQARRVVRSDGKVVEQADHDSRVALGMIAGFPTPEQYERAALAAMEKAAHLRLAEYSQVARDAARRQKDEAYR